MRDALEDLGRGLLIGFFCCVIFCSGVFVGVAL